VDGKLKKYVEGLNLFSSNSHKHSKETLISNFGTIYTFNDKNHKNYNTVLV